MHHRTLKQVMTIDLPTHTTDPIHPKYSMVLLYLTFNYLNYSCETKLVRCTDIFISFHHAKIVKAKLISLIFLSLM